jgi:hypothetical protein
MPPRIVRPQFKVKDRTKILTLEGGAVNTKRQFIIEYLRQRGEEGAYVMEMLRGWKKLCGEIGKNPGTYETFRQAVFMAKQDGLIEPFREVKGVHYYPMVYYRIKRY